MFSYLCSRKLYFIAAILLLIFFSRKLRTNHSTYAKHMHPLWEQKIGELSAAMNFHYALGIVSMLGSVSLSSPPSPVD